MILSKNEQATDNQLFVQNGAEKAYQKHAKTPQNTTRKQPFYIVKAMLWAGKRAALSMQKLCFDIRKHKNSIAVAPKTPFYLCLFSLFGVFFEAVFVIGILQKSKF